MPSQFYQRKKLYFLLIILFLISCDGKERTNSVILSGQALGSKFSIKYLEKPGVYTQEISDYIKKYFIDFQNTTSLYQKDSELIRINNNETNDPILLSRPIGEMLSYALDLSGKTSGIYDVASQNILKLWPVEDISSAVPKNPDSQSLKNAIRHSGYKKVSLIKKNNQYYLIKKDKLVEIDLASLASGYSSDQIASYLKSKGLDDFLVDVGGEFRSSAVKKEYWIIGVENPLNPGEIYLKVKLKNEGLSTSGNYRTASKLKGDENGHIINPVTGQPVEGTVLSVTIISKTGMEADALATAVFAMKENGVDFAKKNHIAACFLFKNKNSSVSMMATESFREYLIK